MVFEYCWVLEQLLPSGALRARQAHLSRECGELLVARQGELTFLRDLLDSRAAAVRRRNSHRAEPRLNPWRGFVRQRREDRCAIIVIASERDENQEIFSKI